MQTKHWIKYAFIFNTSLISLIFILMLWNDTFSNTHENRTSFYTEPNKNVLKVNYILNNKKRYDSFIFGSSRVGAINPLKINTGNYYNMTYSEGIPKEHLLNIKLFIKNGIKINNLLIAVDEFSYQVSYEQHQEQASTKAHYLASGTNIISYYKDLYLRFPLGEDRSHLRKKILGGKQYMINVSQQKALYKIIERDFSKQTFITKGHADNPIFDMPIIYNGNTLLSTLNDIKGIKQVCQKNNINCTFIINPIHNKTYEFTNKKLLVEFRKELSLITDYYDFSFPNTISSNNNYWIETSHFTYEVGDKIIDKIYKNKSSEFGEYINAI